ncbi:MAG: NAD-dependent epimerase/dehydratase family protein [Verrucomicrobia bacterium]|nr:NAD-dependent epimerase/dehydratase family protein [Verrucomicrobiota bacterium]
MKALVTGGAGFIGSHVSEALVRRGHSVVVLDDFSLGSRDNLAWIRPGDPVQVIPGDVGDQALVRRAVEGCDWVFHEAAMPSVPRSISEPVSSNHTNLTAAVQLLEAARAAGVRRWVFASSSAIYGNNETPAKHEALPPEPLSPYALQKYAAETYGRMFHQFHGLPTVSLRYFNVFGPRQSFDSPYSGVIARFCTQALRGQTPVMFGDGLQTRDFVHVSNVVAANIAVAEAPESAVAGRVFNIARGEGVSLVQLMTSLNTILGQSIVPEHREPRVGDVRHSLADISAARTAFGFDPKVGWEEGLRDTLRWYQS